MGLLLGSACTAALLLYADAVQRKVWAAVARYRHPGPAGARFRAPLLTAGGEGGVSGDQSQPTGGGSVGGSGTGEGTSGWRQWWGGKAGRSGDAASSSGGAWGGGGGRGGGGRDGPALETAGLREVLTLPASTGAAEGAAEGGGGGGGGNGGARQSDSQAPSAPVSGGRVVWTLLCAWCACRLVIQPGRCS